MRTFCERFLFSCLLRVKCTAFNLPKISEIISYHCCYYLVKTTTQFSVSSLQNLCYTIKVQNYTIKGIVLTQNKFTISLINADDKESCASFLMFYVIRS